MALVTWMARTLATAIIAVMVGGLLIHPAPSHAQATFSSMAGETLVPLPSWSPLVKRVMPAIVSVTAEMPADAESSDGEAQSERAAGGGEQPDSMFEEFVRRYLEHHGVSPAERLPRPTGKAPNGKSVSLGSAFIVDPLGFIVTNNHVVAHATKITVTFSDSTQHVAAVVGSDPVIDIALLKVSVRRRLPYLQWGDSDKVSVGDWVLAVGNSFGLGGTVTAGVVSALGRDLQQGPFDDFVQIDAPINRGNSGGPTFDTSGRVIGINTSIFSPTGGNVGIGFAIPSSIARVIVQRLREKGHADHGYLGVSVQPITPPIAQTLHMDPEKPNGLLVNAVAEDSPAAKVGVAAGDVILEADGHVVQAPYDVAKFVLTAKVGDRLKLTIDRNGQPVHLEAVVAKAPMDVGPVPAAWRSDTDGAAAPSVLGLWFANLTPDVHRELQLAPSVHGVVVGGVAADSPAAAIGLISGDVIVSINRQPVTEPGGAVQMLRLAAGSGDVLLLVNRHGDSQFVVLSAQSGGDSQ